MADSILDQAFFGLYEFFTNIIPGSIVLATLILFDFNFLSAVSSFSESIQLVLFVLASFIIGVALQGISQVITRHYKYPSNYYLEDADKTFPEYFKSAIRKNANEMFGTQISADSQHVFEVCYLYLLQENVTARVQKFQHSYSFAKSMIATVLVESVLFIILWTLTPSNVMFIVAVIAMLILSYVFYSLYKHYTKIFAKEVLKVFFIKTIKNKNS